MIRGRELGPLLPQCSVQGGSLVSTDGVFSSLGQNWEVGSLIQCGGLRTGFSGNEKGRKERRKKPAMGLRLQMDT